MRLDDPLHAKQVAVLRWISEGCPDGVMAGHSYKQTARALADRRLVTVRRGGGGWSAEVTDTGRYYLEHGEFPARPPVKAPTSRRLPAAEDGDASGGASGPAQASPKALKKKPVGERAPRQPRRVSATEQLVADVVSAGGVLKAADSYPASSRQDMLVAAVNRFNKAPNGQHLAVRRRRDPDDPYRSIRELVLVDGPAGAEAELIPVPVPERVARYHPAVAALRTRDALSMSAGVRSRAWHVLQALAAEAERRGHTVAAAPESGLGPGPAQDHRSRPERWHLEITVGTETVRLRVEEERDRVAHEPTSAELEQQRRSSWTRIPTHDWVASGRLGVRLQGEATSSARRLNWADRTKWRLEDKLPEVLREVAVRADGLRRAREARAEAQARHDREVAAEQDRARDRAAEHHRVEVLDQQLARWREIRELREFARELAERITAAEQALADQDAPRGAGGEEDCAHENGVVEESERVGELANAKAWLAWVQGRVAARDPFEPLPVMPAQRRLREWELTKFMRPVLPPQPGDY